MNSDGKHDASPAPHKRGKEIVQELEDREKMAAARGWTRIPDEPDWEDGETVKSKKKEDEEMEGSNEFLEAPGERNDWDAAARGYYILESEDANATDEDEVVTHADLRAFKCQLEAGLADVEEEFKKRQGDLDEQQRQVRARDIAVIEARERDVVIRENNLKAREEQLRLREDRVVALEKSLAARGQIAKRRKVGQSAMADSMLDSPGSPPDQCSRSSKQPVNWDELESAASPPPARSRGNEEVAEESPERALQSVLPLRDDRKRKEPGGED